MRWNLSRAHVGFNACGCAGLSTGAYLRKCNSPLTPTHSLGMFMAVRCQGRVPSAWAMRGHSSHGNHGDEGPLKPWKPRCCARLDAHHTHDRGPACTLATLDTLPTLPWSRAPFLLRRPSFTHACTRFQCSPLQMCWLLSGSGSAPSSRSVPCFDQSACLVATESGEPQ